MSEDILNSLLNRLSREELIGLLTTDVEPQEEPQDYKDSKLSFTQRYYLTQKIPGSLSKCSSCSRDLINNEEHAIQLLEQEVQE